jgi:hypothetical protein
MDFRHWIIIDFSRGRQPVKQLCIANIHMCRIKLRGFDKPKDEVALLICFLVDHSVYVPKSFFKIYFNTRNFSRIYQEALR